MCGNETVMTNQKVVHYIAKVYIHSTRIFSNAVLLVCPE